MRSGWRASGAVGVVIIIVVALLLVARRGDRPASVAARDAGGDARIAPTVVRSVAAPPDAPPAVAPAPAPTRAALLGKDEVVATAELERRLLARAGELVVPGDVMVDNLAASCTSEVCIVTFDGRPVTPEGLSRSFAALEEGFHETVLFSALALTQPMALPGGGVRVRLRLVRAALPR